MWHVSHRSCTNISTSRGATRLRSQNPWRRGPCVLSMTQTSGMSNMADPRFRFHCYSSPLSHAATPMLRSGQRDGRAKGDVFAQHRVINQMFGLAASRELPQSRLTLPSIFAPRPWSRRVQIDTIAFSSTHRPKRLTHRACSGLPCRGRLLAVSRCAVACGGPASMERVIAQVCRRLSG
jgi:hypothetical protein